MEGGNTGEYANLVRQTDEYGNPLETVLGGNMDTGRQGLSTNVGHATGGAGCHYDFGDTTGVGFGAAGAYINQELITHGHGETRKNEGAVEKINGNRRTDEQKTSPVASGGIDVGDGGYREEDRLARK